MEYRRPHLAASCGRVSRTESTGPSLAPSFGAAPPWRRSVPSSHSLGPSSHPQTHTHCGGGPSPIIATRSGGGFAAGTLKSEPPPSSGFSFTQQGTRYHSHRDDKILFTNQNRCASGSSSRGAGATPIPTPSPQQSAALRSRRATPLYGRRSPKQPAAAAGGIAETGSGAQGGGHKAHVSGGDYREHMHFLCPDRDPEEYGRAGGQHVSGGDYRDYIMAAMKQDYDKPLVEWHCNENGLWVGVDMGYRERQTEEDKIRHVPGGEYRAHRNRQRPDAATPEFGAHDRHGADYREHSFQDQGGIRDDENFGKDNNVECGSYREHLLVKREL